MLTVTVLLILLNVIYGGAIVWCVRSMRQTNPARKGKRYAKIIELKMDKVLARELDKALELDFEIIQSC